MIKLIERTAPEPYERDGRQVGRRGVGHPAIGGNGAPQSSAA